MICLPICVLAQRDTSVVLPLVEIAEKPIRSQSLGSSTQSWSAKSFPQLTQTNLADLLSQEGGLFIKSYGNGSIATTSIRGGSAGHTSVLWNGLAIQSPQLGQLDFSLLPLAFVDEIQLTYGGNSAAWGSGAIGGLINLQNRVRFDSTSQIGLRSTVGSFGFYDQQAQVQYNNGKWGLQTRFFHRQAKNDFLYRIRPDQPEKRQTNAALKQNGILQSLHWRTSEKQELSVQVWLQESDREIPPTTVQNQSLAKQADDFVRTALHWKSIQSRTVWQARLGVFRETIDYQNEQILLRALTGFWIAQAEVEADWSLNDNQRLHFGINHSWMTAEADAYGQTPQQNRTAPFLAFRQNWGRWQWQINLRQEIIDGEFLPLVPGLGVEGQLTNWLSVQGKVSRNYRLPTFNDLYWQPGGNPDLLPESGWSQELGFRLSDQKSQHQNWSYQITAFNRDIDNWILWSRPEGQTFWSANNIAQVWSRGLEQRLRWNKNFSSWKLGLQIGYDYIRSTNEVALSAPKLEKGSQLIYVPKHQAFAGLNLQGRSLQFRYRHTYTGSVSAINNPSLAAYHLGFASLAYQLQQSKWNARLFLTTNNLWNTNYRVIERQVMPGRNFQIGLHFQIHKNKQK